MTLVNFDKLLKRSRNWREQTPLAQASHLTIIWYFNVSGVITKRYTKLAIDRLCLDKMDDKIKVKRPLISHVFHGLWILLTLYKTIDSKSPGQFIWGLLFIAGIALLVRVIAKGSYLVKDGSSLIINGDFFHTTIVQIADIERIEIKPGPFSDSRIILKDDKGKIRFNYHNVNDDDFNELMRSLNIPIK